jgi:lipoprotein-releasing system ATP-binding protein
MNETVIVKAENIYKEYPDPFGGTPVVVLKEISIAVKAGEAVAVVGPSGSGKSTLLNIVSGMDTPTSGTVIFEDREMAEMSPVEMALVRNRNIGFIFQLHHLLPQCTALENVLIPTLPFRRKKGSNAAGGGVRACELLERVGLGGRVNHRPSELSVGERQRVAVARAFINLPDIVLADEPTGSLDAESSALLGELLLDLSRNESIALVVVTHSTDLAEMMGRICRLKNGSLST